MNETLDTEGSLMTIIIIIIIIIIMWKVEVKELQRTDILDAVNIQVLM